MFVPEHPKTFLLDGGLTTWALFVLAHGAAAVISALTIALLALRVLIAYREWRGK
jgi:hypothetical protein